MNVITFEPEHISGIAPQAAQAQWVSRTSAQYLLNLKAMGPAFTGIIDGKPIGSAGIIRTGFGAGLLWAYLSDCGHFIRIHRSALRLLDMFDDFRRIEATTECTFANGCRWLEMLGFEFEGVMRKYGPDGADHARYARLV